MANHWKGRLDSIEGIGPVYAEELRKGGIGSVAALLKMGATKNGRAEMAKATGLSEDRILEWVNRADLLRVKGVGGQYSDLLEQSGIDTVAELAQRNPKLGWHGIGALPDAADYGDAEVSTLVHLAAMDCAVQLPESSSSMCFWLVPYVSMLILGEIGRVSR